MPSAASPARPTYTERLSAPWWMWGFGLIGSLALLIAYAATTTFAIGAAVGAVAFVVIGALLVTTSVSIEVRSDELIAGRARIPVEFLGVARALNADEARTLRGIDADPRAWMVLRGWIPAAVRVDIVDPDDDTPYWYLSSRQPERLAAAIMTAQAGDQLDR